MDTPKPKIIALYSDYPKCGKSTVASIIANNRKTVTFSFASPIKHTIRHLLMSLNVDEPYLYEDPENKDKVIPELGVTMRYLWQTLGHEWGRKLISENIWVDRLPRFIKELGEPHYINMYTAIKSDAEYILIDDLRYENEYAAIKAIPDSVMVKVTRPITIKEAEAIHEATKHSSEGNLYYHDFPYRLNNNGSKEELINKVEDLLCFIEGDKFRPFMKNREYYGMCIR